MRRIVGTLVCLATEGRIVFSLVCLLASEDRIKSYQLHHTLKHLGPLYAEASRAKTPGVLVVSTCYATQQRCEPVAAS